MKFFINSLVSNKNILCGLTTTAELCDNFKDRKKGGIHNNEILQKSKFDKYFLFTQKKKISKNLNIMN